MYEQEFKEPYCDNDFVSMFTVISFLVLFVVVVVFIVTDASSREHEAYKSN